MGWHTCVYSSSDSSVYVVGDQPWCSSAPEKRSVSRKLPQDHSNHQLVRMTQEKKPTQKKVKDRWIVNAPLDSHPHQMTIGRFNKFKIGFSTSCLSLVKPIKPIRTRFTFGNKTAISKSIGDLRSHKTNCSMFIHWNNSLRPLRRQHERCCCFVKKDILLQLRVHSERTIDATVVVGPLSCRNNWGELHLMA